MSSPNIPVFPASKIKEIVMQDPDVKEIAKPAVETLRLAAEYFADFLFQKTFHEAAKRGKVTADNEHFKAAIRNDKILSQIYAQFFFDQAEIQNTDKKEDDSESDVMNTNENEAEEKIEYNAEEKSEEENDNNEEEENHGEEEILSEQDDEHSPPQSSDHENAPISEDSSLEDTTDS